MAVMVKCSSCGTQLTAPNGLWGAQGRCPKCAAAVPITPECLCAFVDQSEADAKYITCPNCDKFVWILEGACPLCDARVIAGVASSDQLDANAAVAQAATRAPAASGPATAPARDFQNRAATAALVMGIVTLFLGILAGIVAIVLGTIGLVRSYADRPLRRGRGLAIAGICCAVVGAALLPWGVLGPALVRAHEMARRAVCAANLRGVGQAMHIYANDNLEWFPHSIYREPDGHMEPSGPPNRTAVSFIGELARSYTMEKWFADESCQRAHPSRSLFMLVTAGLTTPKQFICPSSGDLEDLLRNKSAGGETTARPGIDRLDFRGYNMLSFGYQLPFGRYGKPREGMDPRMPISADKGPYFEADSLDPGDGSVHDRPAQAQAPELALRLTEGDVLRLPAERWRPYNSRNHHSAGQNVLFVDAHAAFCPRPLAGINFDNIYTEQTGFTLRDSLQGRQPRDGYGPFIQTDAVIVP